MKALVLLTLLSLPAAVEASTRTVTEVVDMANKVMRGDSSRARLKMTVVTKTWTRTMEVEAWHRGRTMAYILIHAPAKDKGTTTLRRGSEIWTWMPRVERLIKVPPTMMHSSWQGSDFNFEDIVKADSIVKDYDHKLLKKTAGPEREEWVIEALPKPDAPVVWGKVLFTVGVYPDGWVVPVKEEDYSERGELIRTITLSRVKDVGGRRVPTRLECAPTRTPGRRTEIDYSDIAFELDIPESFFSVSRLQK
ncbi:MAG: outer membrane lipoprotein-sorting protein [Elusimicrobia bacterium]|nr:outer membrane lipoprotein-sorting protein [Elusimicrobiota bacterium]